MTFPEVIHLNPGMVKEIDVAFRPVTYENYNDTIYFRVVEDLSLNDQMPPIGFHVPVRAFISTLQVATAGSFIHSFIHSTTHLALPGGSLVPFVIQWWWWCYYRYWPLRGWTLAFAL